MKIHPFFCFILFLFVLAGGCVELHYKGSPYEGSYCGLRKRWDDRTNNSKLGIIMVHGMGGLGDTVPGYGDPFAKSLAKLLNLSVERDNKTNGLLASNGVINFLRTFKFTNELNDQLKFYEVTWSPMTSNIKAGQFAKDYEMYSNHNRFALNQDLKQLVDIGFGDAALYLNPYYREYMQQPILQTIGIVNSEMTNDDDQIVFVTHSLGSKMAFDTLLANANDDVVIGILKKTTDIIMLANQLPLLDLGIETNELAPSVASTVGALPASPTLAKLQSILGHRKKHRPPPNDTTPDVTVVAATDPNDALSYPLKSGTSSVGLVTFSYADIYRYNDKGILDLFENPITAHTNYFQNIDLIKKLVSGFR